MSGDSSSSELNPYSVVKHRLSTPPTSAASTSPVASNRAALANTFALDEQAVDTTHVGPRRASACATNAASEKVFWVWA